MKEIIKHSIITDVKSPQKHDDMIDPKLTKLVLSSLYGTVVSKKNIPHKMKRGNKHERNH